MDGRAEWFRLRGREARPPQGWARREERQRCGVEDSAAVYLRQPALRPRAAPLTSHRQTGVMSATNATVASRFAVIALAFPFASPVLLSPRLQLRRVAERAAKSRPHFPGIFVARWVESLRHRCTFQRARLLRCLLPSSVSGLPGRDPAEVGVRAPFSRAPVTQTRVRRPKNAASARANPAAERTSESRNMPRISAFRAGRLSRG
jgi:hypothetical protein